MPTGDPGRHTRVLGGVESASAQVVAHAFGDQQTHVVREAHARASHHEAEAPRISAHAAVTFAKERNLEREAVVHERMLLRDALTRSMGEQSVEAVTVTFEQRVAAGEFINVAQRPGAPGRAFTTPEMIALERETIGLMQAGQQAHTALSAVTSRDLAVSYPHLHDGQRSVAPGASVALFPTRIYGNGARQYDSVYRSGPGYPPRG